MTLENSLKVIVTTLYGINVKLPSTKPNSRF